MLLVYINYPVPHMTLHHDPNCSTFRMSKKPNQRILLINNQTISSELGKFSQAQYRFGATKELNDMWLKIDFGDEEFEHAVARHIHKLIGQHYEPLSRKPPQEHC